ncbi:DUF1801 domain-containing protein [Sorangium sp. So ce1097]|uniref:DUF1801 domain-containing protein n=1 Tax=Sorangium sp. So ce1097 TaxID=3133330 RepID=UPI003F5F3771
MRRTDEKASKPRARTQKGPSAGGAPQQAPGKPVAPREPGSSQTHPAVIAFLRELDHPLKQEIDAVRRIILAVSPEIREEIKWNAPSFRTAEHFATFNLRTKDRVRLVLHMGAKVKGSATKGVEIGDPAGLLEWRAKNRCLVTFVDEKEIQEKRAALETILRAWIRLM